jgi:hypothetical protein
MFHPEGLFQVYAEFFIKSSITTLRISLPSRAEPTRALKVTLSRARWIQCISSHRRYWRSIVILSSHLCQNLRIGIFPSGLPIKILHFSSSNDCYMASQTQLSGFNNVNNIWRRILITKLLTEASCKPCFLFWVEHIPPKPVWVYTATLLAWQN